jgi:hypothetical protein
MGGEKENGKDSFRDFVAKTFADFSKIILAAAFTSEFFVKGTPEMRIMIFAVFFWLMALSFWVHSKKG